MIIYVNSFEEAKSYPVMFNTSEIFFHNSQDKFYCKAVDKMGKSSMSTYEFHQVENEKPLTSADFVPREQFDALTSKMDALMSLLTQPQQPLIPQPVPEQPKQATAQSSKRNQSKEVTTNG